MSQRNVEVVRKAFDAAGRGDWNAFFAAYSLDVEWDDRDLRPEGAARRGIEEMREELRIWVGTWVNYRQQVEQMLEVNDQVVVVLRERGEGKGSGALLDHRIGIVLTVRDDLIVKQVLYRDPDDALQTAKFQ
jgi:ketosteroid isomerase-like protein